VPRARAQALSALGLRGDASIAEVTRAFRHRARELHPDLHRGAAFAERRSVEQRFAALSAAYHALIR
jgi:DnaJ-class molecular chaperone